MAYNPITTTEISVGKATKRSLWQKIKDNFDYLFGQTTPGGLLNGSFEYDSDADGIPDNWTRNLYPGGSSGFYTISTEHGEKSYYFTHPGGAGNGGGYMDSDYIAVSSEQYSAQVSIRSTVTGIKNIVQVLYYDKAKVYLSSADLYNATAPNTNANTVTANYTAPANARFIKYRLIGGYTDTAVAGTTYFDGLRHFHVPDAAISQPKLKTTTGEVSVSAGATSNVTLPGGSYGFYPQLKNTSDSGIVQAFISGSYNSGAYGTVIYLNLNGGTSGAGYAQQRYLQASPPYKIGNITWGHFLFLLRDITTGAVKAAYEAEDPPWAYNGAIYLLKNDPGRLAEVPHPFADYWLKDPAVDGLEIVLVDLTMRNVMKAKQDNAKVGKGLLEDIPALIAGKGKPKPHAAYGLPNIPRFSDKVKICEP